MTFTDEDLKRLKEYIGKGELYQFLDDEHEGQEIDESEDNYISINALLARLEAAEAVASYANYDEVPETIKEAWRRACGRE